MKVGILGSGEVAKALAGGFLRYAHEVTLGTPAPRISTADMGSTRSRADEGVSAAAPLALPAYSGFSHGEFRMCRSSTTRATAHARAPNDRSSSDRFQ